jgi:hypothetical protein
VRKREKKGRGGGWSNSKSLKRREKN